MNNQKDMMKFINLSVFFISLFVWSSNSLASDSHDIFTAEPEHLWKIGKNTLAKLSLNSDYTDRENPFVLEAQKRSMDWIKKWQIITDPTILHKINISNFAKLIGKAHPDATVDELTIVVLFCLWLFIYDDVVEDERSEEVVFAMHARSLEIINETVVIDEEKDSPINKGLNEIIEMMRKEFNPSVLWKSRFWQDVKDYCDATVWELRNRKEKKFPTIEDYKTYRPNTGATKPMFDFIELIDKNEKEENNEIPEKIFKDPYFQKIRFFAANLIDWENDIGSLFKEKINKDFHNLVIVHMANEHSSYQEAFNFVGETLKSDLDQFKELSKEIPNHMKSHEKEVRTYLNGLWQWLAANHYWAADSARYNPPNWVNSRENTVTGHEI